MTNVEIREYEGGDFGEIEDNYTDRQIQVAIANRADKAYKAFNGLSGDIAELNQKVAALATDFSYKGSVADYAHLPSDAAIGDVYTTEDEGYMYVWDGTQWQILNMTGAGALTGSSDPTTSTEGTLGQLYLNTTSGELFYCSATGDTYTWVSLDSPIQSISVNGTAVTPDENKNVALTIPDGIKTLTTADYNSPVDNPTHIDPELLDDGIYVFSVPSGGANVKCFPVYLQDSSSDFIDGGMLIKSSTGHLYNRGDGTRWCSGSKSAREAQLGIVDNLTSTNSKLSLSAAQGKYLNDTKANKTAFTGTDGTAAGVMGLVPAPATTDAGKVLSASGAWTGLPDGIRTLTTADYNYPTSGTPTSVALWLLPPGVYKNDTGVYWQKTSSGAVTNPMIAIVGKYDSSNGTPLIILAGGALAYAGVSKGGASLETFNMANDTLVTTQSVKNNLTTTDTSTNRKYPLSAPQGKVLKDLIDSLVIKNAGAPTTSTVGTIGQLLEDTTNGKLYQCTAIDNTDPQAVVYTWTEVGGGSGPTVVQTTGTSTTDVMSQNAVTSMVFADPSTKNKVQIGNDSSASGVTSVAIGGKISTGAQATAEGAIAIGAQASASGVGSIAFGAMSIASVKGTVSFNTSSPGFGYNNSAYRLLTGLYDPQSAHDAATKGYVDGTTESVTIADTDWSALSSSDPYTYSATKTLTATIGANSTVELINDNAVSFGTYGFAIGAVDQPNNTITVYAIGSPSASVNLKINVKGA